MAGLPTVPCNAPAASVAPHSCALVKAEGTSRVTWEIEPIEDSCRLTVTHDQLRSGANSELYGGWPMILSGLKTLLETGQTLTTPGSLRYLGRAYWAE
jgi:Activator of Hsp90 ATPase homolog 1-like protein